ncbi:MAG: hypothetical protein IZT55_06255, partial [Anaerolineae bacterium]|nr:hypothetical protein [Anaerolineae bacterium]
MQLDLIIDLKRAIDQDHWNRVISSLRQDNLVWGALQDFAFRKKAIKQLGSKAENWSPANLILLKLEIAPNTSFSRLKSEILDTAEKIYQSSQTTNADQNDLRQAGLLAMALFNHPGDWETLPLTLPWSTALACLYAWTPNKSSFINSLHFSHAAHVIFANPLDVSEQQDLLKSRIKMDSPEIQQLSLQLIRAQRPKVASALASDFINHKKNYHPKTPHQYLIKSHHNAENQAHTDEVSHALISYDEVINTASHIKSQAVLGAAQMEIKSGLPDQALARWQAHQSESLPEQKAQLALNFMERDYFDQADQLALVSHQDAQLITQVAIARLKAHHGDLQLSRGIIKRVLEVTNLSHESLKTHWHELLSAMIEVGLYSEIILLAPKYLKNHPNDTQTIQAHSQAQHIAGNLNDAISYAHLAVVLQPQDNNLRQNLAEALEADRQWDAAFSERETIIRNKIEPQPKDFYHLAYCALSSGKPQQAADISQQALLNTPEDGLAHTISGEALLALGLRQQATNQFELAIQIAPELPDPWLALADDQLKTNEHAAALQTLKSAASAVPNSPKIHLSLGEIYQSQLESTKALNAFRRAS